MKSIKKIRKTYKEQINNLDMMAFPSHIKSNKFDYVKILNVCRAKQS